MDIQLEVALEDFKELTSDEQLKLDPQTAATLMLVAKLGELNGYIEGNWKEGSALDVIVNILQEINSKQW